MKKILSYSLDLPNGFVVSLIFLLAFLTRFYKLETPAWVCWDETHFGKFANYYINSSFYFDVHPPLGKMLYAFVGALTGYNANFTFKEAGMDYSYDFYVPMRQLAAGLGVITILFIYGMAYELTYSIPAATIAAFFVLCDTGSLTLTRYILLDPPLLCFMCGSMYFYLKYRNSLDKNDIFQGCEYLIFAGYFMAFCMSVKMVGFFTFATIGIITAIDLFTLLIDDKTPVENILDFIKTRLLFLLLIPFIIFYVLFVCHLLATSASGPGDSSFSPQFQFSLYGNDKAKDFRNISKHVTHKSMVVLKGCDTNSNYLHSHRHLYPKEHGPEQQQVTGYSFVDPNSYWFITKVSGSKTNLIENGDTIMLTHNATRHNLHSHNEKAPINTEVYQVTGYGNGNSTIQDTNDYWIVKILNNPLEKKRIGPISTQFSLYHKNMNCELMFSGDKLPKWGFDQEESICNQHLGHSRRCWVVVNNQSPSNETGNVDITDSIKLGWVSRIMEYQHRMISINNNLFAKSYEMPSQPWMWPINYKGIWFSGKSEHRVYLLGNPILWWTCLFIIFNYPIVFGVFSLYSLRYPTCSISVEWNESNIRKCWTMYLFWALNYIPYFFMGRVLYYHHYFPSYHISCVIAGVVLNSIIESLVSSFKNKDSNETKPLKIHKSFSIFHMLLLAGIVFSFYCFSFLSYGMTGNIADKVPNNSTYSAYRWMGSWEF